MHGQEYRDEAGNLLDVHSFPIELDEVDPTYVVTKRVFLKKRDVGSTRRWTASLLFNVGDLVKKSEVQKLFPNDPVPSPTPPTPAPPNGGGGSSNGSYSTTFEPTTVLDVIHNLGYSPAGFYIVADNGDQEFPLTVTHPIPGVSTRFTFGATVGGTVNVS